MRVQRELMRGAGPAAVLSLLATREMYGYELVQALSRQTDGILGMGQSTLYPLLYNLEAKELVRSRWRASESGRRRKYYAPTEKGLAWLAGQRTQWSGLMGAMTRLGVVDPGSREG